MFTEGLDPNALRWVREGQGSVSRQQNRIDPFRSIRNGGGGGRGLGVPPPEKFRSGHLPKAAMPISHAIRTEDVESGSGSDMDESSDTEAENYVGRYSIDSSSRDDDNPNGSSRRSGIGNRYVRPVSAPRYYSSDGYSDISSSRDTAPRQQQPQQFKKPVRVNGYVEEEEELSDSGGSSEFSSQARVPNGGSYVRETYSRDRPIHGGVNGASRGINPAENYNRNVPFREAANVAADKASVTSQGNYQSDNYSHRAPFRDNMKVPSNMNGFTGVPSAPPIHGCDEEISQATDQISAARSCCTRTIGSNSSTLGKEPSSHVNEGSNIPDQNSRTTLGGAEVGASSSSLPAKVPTFHASGQGPWHSVIAYDACVRLCLHSWARGCMEAPIFLENECALLRSTFGLQQILLQSEEELLAKRTSELSSEGAAPKPKKTIGKLKVQVRKVRMSLDMPSGCSFSSLRSPVVKIETLRYRLSNVQSTLSSGWESLRKVRVLPHLPANSSFSRHSLAYMHASAQYIKQVSGLLKVGVTTLRSSSSYEIVQETYSCQLRLKSSAEDSCVRMQPGSGETHVFFPDSLGDDLIIDIYDSKGKSCGRVVGQVASIAEDPTNKLRWWSIYREPEHELVGRIQLYANYTTTLDENGNLKYGSVAETVAYDIVLEVAMKTQHFQQRNLLLHGSWKWLLTEFASYYGVSDAYTKLRYLSYVMDVATPTEDCLTLVHDLLLPVVMKSRSNNTLSHQENRILGEIKEQIEHNLEMLFENYKSLDESLPSGMVEGFRPATGLPAPALAPAVKLYNLLYDILSPEAQLKLCKYFQAAAKKRARRHLLETDEYVAGNTECNLMDVVTYSTAYQKMRALCFNIRNEISTDIEIHNQHVLPSFVDLPNLAASIYSVELSSRLRAFLVACPPTGPSSPVADLVIATAEFQKDLASWNICPIKGGVDAKELFHLYIILWIQDKRLSLLESCKLDKVKWSGVRTQHMTTPFVDDMYEQLKNTLLEYEVIICRWPEYIFALENAIADVEKAVIEALEKQYADVLAPLKDSMTPKKFGLKYVHKLAKRNSISPYIVPDELGILLNTMKRLLDVLRPKIEAQLKSWGSCMPDGGNAVAGDCLNEVTVTLRAKFRNYLQAVVEKLAENTRLQSNTKLKKIIQDSKDMIMESDIRSRMQPLKDQLVETINHVRTVFGVHVFVAVCRGFWDRLGQDVLSFLENRKENRSWYKGARVTVAVLDDTFASQMQQLLGNALQEKDLEPPRSSMEVRSMLCKDAAVKKDSNFYY
ncbi:uncharacterized protein LOC109711557 isoform X2 [Ananas comosus]|uniref:Uncharacterized protein LOC109711557 isoform X2 n=1 Tax=Ananas comosus TaxID=4615 RepID=A0A6P5F9Y7_ANACO|nr:uncharacterized protein LOC109711557 isoform X2 [Ananas comosus]